MSDTPESLTDAMDAPISPPIGLVPDADAIRRIVEAALLASHQPLTVQQLYALFPEEVPAPKDSIEQSLQALSAETESRGVELVEVASGFRYQVRADVHPWVARLWTERSTRYTRATLETLALIAYRQPITRGEIEQIRGVAVSSNIIKLLEERDFIRVIGHRDVPGRPALFGTTRALLDYFGLKSLDELPPLAEIRDLTDLAPQLPFDTNATEGRGQITLSREVEIDDAASVGGEPLAEQAVGEGVSDEAHVAEGHDQPTLSREVGEGEPLAERTVGEGASDDAIPNETTPEPFPNLENATDVVLDPTIPFIADTQPGAFPHDADDAAPEHTA